MKWVFLPLIVDFAAAYNGTMHTIDKGSTLLLHHIISERCAMKNCRNQRERMQFGFYVGIGR
jgi:hypothetical protein